MGDGQKFITHFFIFFNNCEPNVHNFFLYINYGILSEHMEYYRFKDIHLFIRFLKDNRLQECYRFNVEHDDQNYYHLLLNTTPSEFILLGFTWTLSNEGWKYWNYQHKKWQNVLNLKQVLN